MRFAFGKNWRSFLELLNENRIEESVRAVRTSLGRGDLIGCRVLDIGSGSGLSSLAMRRMGARLVSFDFDTDSVACTRELRERFFPNDPDWEIMQGSVLDEHFMTSLGTFDVVYAWGVLHHTGNMWRAIDLSLSRVGESGTFLVALYNDQGWRSRVWWHIKRVYCSSWLGRATVVATFYPLFAAYALALDVRRGEMPGSHARGYARQRGMSLTHDWKDWLGGYPFEVTSRRELSGVVEPRGFALQRESLTRGWGCNEFVYAADSTRHGE